MKLEISTHCYNYQRRLNWMLNSVLQQEGDIPDIQFSVSYLPNTGSPTVETLIEFFQDKGLNIKGFPINDGRELNRSWARNERTVNTDADWIIFADSDMVYSKHFFATLKEKVQLPEFKNETRCIGADRVSLNIPHCIEFFDNDGGEYPRIIEDVENVVNKWPVFRTGGRNTAAGYFQMANVELMRERGLTYPVKKRDGYRTYKADRAFRCVLGGRVGMILPPQYHLNHSRDQKDKQR